SPLNGARVPAGSITISGKAYDVGANASGVTEVTVNNLPATLNQQNGTWTLNNFSLAVGNIPIIARARDAAGNPSNPYSITVTGVTPDDTQKPSITINSPLDAFTTQDATITVTGTAVDEGIYATGVRRVTVNDQPATYDPATHQ